MKAWVWAGLLVGVVAFGGCDREPPPAQNSLQESVLVTPTPTGGTPGPTPIPYPNVAPMDPAAKSGTGTGKSKGKTSTLPDGGSMLIVINGLSGNDGG